MEPRTKLRTRLLLHQFCMTLLLEKDESNKTNANKVLYEASYKAPLTRKIRILNPFHSTFLGKSKKSHLSFIVYVGYRYLLSSKPLVYNNTSKEKRSA